MTDADAVAAALAGTDLACARCGATVERGYLVAEGDEPLTETVVCETCGWGEVGHAGCAPERRDFERGDALLRIERADDGYEATVTDE